MNSVETKTNPVDELTDFFKAFEAANEVDYKPGDFVKVQPLGSPPNGGYVLGIVLETRLGSAPFFTPETENTSATMVRFEVRVGYKATVYGAGRPAFCAMRWYESVDVCRVTDAELIHMKNGTSPFDAAPPTAQPTPVVL